MSERHLGRFGLNERYQIHEIRATVSWARNQELIIPRLIPPVVNPDAIMDLHTYEDRPAVVAKWLFKTLCKNFEKWMNNHESGEEFERRRIASKRLHIHEIHANAVLLERLRTKLPREVLQQTKPGPA